MHALALCSRTASKKRTADIRPLFDSEEHGAYPVTRLVVEHCATFAVRVEASVGRTRWGATRHAQCSQSRRTIGDTTPKRRTRPDCRPDLDKPVRSTLDALTTAGAIDDDARVVEINARKHYAKGWTGATVAVGLRS